MILLNSASARFIRQNIVAFTTSGKVCHVEFATALPKSSFNYFLNNVL
jgi:hypothetical protein